MIFTASGSHITRSLSEPTAILPFRGYRLKILAALVLVTATNWFSSIFPVACSHTKRTKSFYGERVSKSSGKHHPHSHTSCWLAGPELLRLILLTGARQTKNWGHSYSFWMFTPSLHQPPLLLQLDLTVKAREGTSRVSSSVGQ